MQTKSVKPKIIKPTILLADSWENYFVFQDFIGFKNWDMPVLKKKKRGFVISEYQMCGLIKIDESKLLLGCFSDILRGMIYSGLFAIIKCSNIYDKTAEKLTEKMKLARCESNRCIEELLSKINLSNKDNLENIDKLFTVYGSNDLCKKYYKEFFKKDMEVPESINIKICDSVKKICFEITNNKPNIHCLKIEKNKETKIVSLWIHREMLIMAEKIQQTIFKDYMISEILRGALIQGLYMLSYWIVFNKFDNNEQNTLKIITGLEDIITGDV